MWGDHAVAHAVNQKLHPIMMTNLDSLGGDDAHGRGEHLQTVRCESRCEVQSEAARQAGGAHAKSNRQDEAARAELAFFGIALRVGSWRGEPCGLLRQVV